MVLGLCGLGRPLLAQESGAPRAILPSVTFDLGDVVRGRTVQREFVLRNAGTAPLVIQKAMMTPPLRMDRMPAQVPPGASATLRFVLDSAKASGPFEGQVILFLNDTHLPQAKLAVEANIVHLIEVAPLPAFFVSAVRGQQKQQALEIVNHDAAPLKIEAVRHAPGKFTSRVETIADGQRYRLIISVRPDAAMGRSAEAIEVETSNPSRPVVKIPVNLWVHGRVYAFPETVNFGIVPESAGQDPVETVMVYQAGGKNFTATAETDIAGLEVRLERANSGDRYKLTARLRRGLMQRGPIRGLIRLDTNDAEFRHVAIPVAGAVR